MGVKEIPEFVDREKELREIKELLSGRPNLVYFVYGPINSGKTALLTKVFEELGEDYIVFYFNFRGIYIRSIEDLLQVLFEIKVGEYKTEIKEIVKEILKIGAKKFKKIKGIPIPESIFDRIFSGKKLENIFRYLESVFEEIREQRKTPIFVLDEMQVIKELINDAGRPIIHELFNFMVRLTKETHLCHCLCATSDCLFIEDVYTNARLEGRSRYILVDDLDKETAFRVYEEFGFEEKELVWKYIRGKLGDMVILYEWKKQGYKEEKGLREMLKNEIGKLRMIEGDIYEKYEDAEGLWEYLKEFKDGWERYAEIRKDKRYLFFWIDRNVLFYNPVEGTVRPQSRLIQRAIRELERCL